MTTKALIKLLEKLPANTQVSLHNPKETRWVGWVDLKPAMVDVVDHGAGTVQVYLGGPPIKA